MPEAAEGRHWRKSRGDKIKKKAGEEGRGRRESRDRTERVLCLLVVFVYCDRDRWRLTAGPLQGAS